MNKKYIIQHLQGELTYEDDRLIYEWIEESEANKLYYAELKDLFILTQMPEREANAEELLILDSILGKKKQDDIIYRVFRVCRKNISVAILIALIFNLFFLVKEDNNNAIFQKKEEVSLQIAYTNKGIKSKIVLPDGSEVILNSDSRLVYPLRFDGETREVNLIGEAQFNVKSNPEVPMIVTSSNGLRVNVLGTRFNLRAYENADKMEVTLYKGKIEVFARKTKDSLAGADIRKILSPRETFIIYNDFSTLIKTNIDTLKTQAWVQGNLLFEQESMKNVIEELTRWYGVEFNIMHPEIYNIQFSANFKSESIIQVLDVLKSCSPINYSLIDNRINLYL